MNLLEWPLVAFTLLFQAGAGAAVFFWTASGKGTGLAPDLILLVSAAVSALLSLFHLGRPFRAPRSVVNLGRSWLSREILFLIGFGASAAGLVADEIFNLNAEGVFLPAAAILGLACVFVMAKIYTLPSVPDWNTWRTPGAFFSATFVLGGTIAGVTVDGLKIPVLAVLAAAFFFTLVFSPRFGLAGRRATALGFRPDPAWPKIFAVRIALLAAAFLFWGLACLIPESASWTGYASLGAAVASEAVGRLQFYDIPLGLSPRS
ncbi:MAG: dimethyl sulfoxide reductase anchor subunit [Candidatus Aminicenantes bacterium]|nr:dimethyl sulfoxide reductase anchor subunit [Candidatus Aminicenantes bacterium]